MLLRGFWIGKARLLLWSGLCFLMFTLDNLLLFVDIAIFPEIDQSLMRIPAALIGLVFLLYGMIWEAR